MEENITDKKKTNTMVFIFTVVIMILLLAVILYSVLGNKKEPNNEKEPETIVNVDKITNVDKIEITDTDKTIYIDTKEYKIKRQTTVDGEFLLIDDNIVERDDSTTVFAQTAYVTNKFAIFTAVAQDWDKVMYAMDKDGNRLTVDDSDYQIHDLTVVDGELHAQGHVFCGLDGDCPDQDLLIKYDKDNNTLKISKVEE